jgi:SAM-dependent MidA family methyltransferase
LTAEPFPVPDAQALEVSEALVERIRQEIDANQGWISFERYMQLALYEPGLGYYSAGAAKFGAGGDFTTAPELGDWLADAVAPFVNQVLAELGSSHLIELGAGTGKLAGQLLERLSRRGDSPVDYAILETSADLKQRQANHIGRSGFGARWIDRLPGPNFRGVVIANEVADALPVVRFVKSGANALPLGLTRSGQGFAVVPGAADAALSESVSRIEAVLGWTLPDGYRSEVCSMLRPWLAEVLGSIAEGGLLLIDYGMPRRDYFRPERSDGTLICHYRQRAHSNALLWPGLQDITAWVDFSEVADIARESGFVVAGFTTQAQFLLESLTRDAALSTRQPTPQQASVLKTLVLPGEMGERFKLMWLTTESIGTALPGRDFRNWL